MAAATVVDEAAGSAAAHAIGELVRNQPALMAQMQTLARRSSRRRRRSAAGGSATQRLRAHDRSDLPRRLIEQAGQRLAERPGGHVVGVTAEGGMAQRHVRASPRLGSRSRPATPPSGDQHPLQAATPASPRGRDSGHRRLPGTLRTSTTSCTPAARSGRHKLVAESRTMTDSRRPPPDPASPAAHPPVLPGQPGRIAGPSVFFRHL